MTYAGARNQTEREMAGTLHFSLPQTNLHAAFGALTARMNRVQRPNRITLAAANSLWSQQDYPFANDFVDLIRSRYDAEAHSVDFLHSTPAVADQINQCVGQRTKGKITGAIGRDRLNANTRLVLCNEIYFKGKWQRQFKAGDTKPMDFMVSTNQAVKVPMMSQDDRFKVAHNEEGTVEMLELPYVGDDLSMIILLPTARSGTDEFGLADLENELTAENLRAWLKTLDQRDLHQTWVKLPRFSITRRCDLVKVLAAMGMPSAFGVGADFSGMEASTNLFLSGVMHQACVEVTEAGTEAAAVTLSQAATKSMAGRFVADHPFLFLIRDNGSGSILFLGRMVDPTKETG
jgi:serpin B